ncbi:hypothetical protein [Rubripirellula lacrimiformis]|nr:hypothetical protein [Rubripirellula lacrimiformis]
MSQNQMICASKGRVRSASLLDLAMKMGISKALAVSLHCPENNLEVCE